jgi:hypothetical protein
MVDDFPSRSLRNCCVHSNGSGELTVVDVGAILGNIEWVSVITKSLTAGDAM